jgi:hypothetical protein
MERVSTCQNPDYSFLPFSENTHTQIQLLCRRVNNQTRLGYGPNARDFSNRIGDLLLLRTWDLLRPIKVLTCRYHVLTVCLIYFLKYHIFFIIYFITRCFYHKIFILLLI